MKSTLAPICWVSSVELSPKSTKWKRKRSRKQGKWIKSAHMLCKMTV